MQFNQSENNNFNSATNLTMQDQENLNLLSVLGRIWGGLIIVLCTLSFLGLLFILLYTSAGDLETILLAAYVFVLGASGGLTFYAAQCLSAYKNKTFIQVMAALNCLSVPIGLAWGVFVFIVLSRPAVSAAFDNR